MKSDTVVWAGLDYSLVRMIGTNDFQVPDMIFPDMLESWNNLFLDERIHEMAKSLDRRISVDISGVKAKNKTASKSQIIRCPLASDTLQESHIDAQQIAESIKSYKLENTNGLGLVFVIDRFIEKNQGYSPEDPRQRSNSGRFTSPASGAVYVVFFDVESREVISLERQTQTVKTGGGFRNFWFGVIKRTDSSLGKYRLGHPHTNDIDWRRNR